MIVSQEEQCARPSLLSSVDNAGEPQDGEAEFCTVSSLIVRIPEFSTLSILFSNHLQTCLLKCVISASFGFMFAQLERSWICTAPKEEYHVSPEAADIVVK